MYENVKGRAKYGKHGIVMMMRNNLFSDAIIFIAVLTIFANLNGNSSKVLLICWSSAINNQTLKL